MLTDWTILFYLCDNDDNDAHLKRLLRATASKKLSIAFQRKGAAGAERFIIPKSRPQEAPAPVPTWPGRCARPWSL
jgi:hypothetical protein